MISPISLFCSIKWKVQISTVIVQSNILIRNWHNYQWRTQGAKGLKPPHGPYYYFFFLVLDVIFRVLFTSFELSS